MVNTYLCGFAELTTQSAIRFSAEGEAVFEKPKDGAAAFIGTFPVEGDPKTNVAFELFVAVLIAKLVVAAGFTEGNGNVQLKNTSYNYFECAIKIY